MYMIVSFQKLVVHYLLVTKIKTCPLALSGAGTFFIFSFNQQENSEPNFQLEITFFNGTKRTVKKTD